MKNYPDISELLEKKMKRRRQLARLAFEEKIEIVDKWRELNRQIRKLRHSDQHLISKRLGDIR